MISRETIATNSSTTGIERFKRDDVEGLTSCNSEVQTIIEALYRASKGRHSPIAEITVPYDITAHDYAQNIGTTAITELYTSEFTTINVATVVCDPDKDKAARAKLEKIKRLSLGISFLFIEGSNQVDPNHQDNLNDLKEFIAELGMPSAELIEV